MSVQVRAVKGRQQNKDFFEGKLTFAGVHRNVLLPDNKQWDQLFGDEGAGEGAQRKLNTARVKNEIVPYIVDNDNAFFSAITLVMVPMGAASALKEGVGNDYWFKPLKDPDTGKDLDMG